MIIGSRHFLWISTAAVLFTACAAPTHNAPAPSATADSEANAARPVATFPTAGALLALEKQAIEAYLEGDDKFFESFLSDKFVMLQGGSRLSKTDAVQMISGVECEIQEGWSVSDPEMVKIDDDTYVLSYRITREGSCTEDGKTEKMPSPVRATTVWVGSGEEWQAVFHGENLIFDPQAPPATDRKEEPKDDRHAANADPTTDALMAAERSIWEAWRTHDAEKIEDLTAREITFVNIFGTYFANKAATVKDWTSETCDVESFVLTDGVGTSVSPTVGILTLRGTVEGACSGQDISGQVIYGTSVYVKEGDSWKWAFGFNSPS